MNSRILIKIGGRAFEGQDGFRELGQVIKTHLNTEVMIVHGGGREISKGYFSSLKPADRRRVSVMTKNPRVYVRGHVRHPDHRTIYLDNWHHVLLNSERTTRNLAFLD